MTRSSVPPQYEEIIHIKVVALPYTDPVEFNTSEARDFAEKILAAVERIEGKWRPERNEQD